MRTGSVLRIMRNERLVEVICPPGEGRLFARYPQGAPPPPFSTVCLDRVNGPHWWVVGSPSDRRVAMHDDFTRIRVGEYGDTNWNVQPGSTYAQVPNAGTGVLRLTTTTANASAAVITKGDGSTGAPDADMTLWLSWRSRAVTLTSCNHFLGFMNDAFTSGAVFRWFHDSGGFFEVRAAATVSVPVDNTTAGGAFEIFDLVVDGGIAALWVDGSGPHVLTSTGIVDSTLRFFISNSAAGATRSMDIDWVHLETFTGAQRPDLLTTPAGTLTV